VLLLLLLLLLLFKIFIAKEIYRACPRTNDKIVPGKSLKECLYSSKSGMKVNVNNGRRGNQA
jgi:hypothetical protein